MPDADAQAPEGVATMDDQVFQPVVAARSAALLEPQRTDRKIQLVMRHQQALGGDLVEASDGGRDLAAVVHVVHGLDEPQILAADARARELCVEARFSTKHAPMTARAPPD